MKSPLQPHVDPVIYSILVLLAAVLLLPGHARAECREFRIVEYEDRVEAVCVGEPLSEAQKKANLEEERRQELEAQRQRVEEDKQQRAAAAATKAKADAEAERKRRSTPPATPPPVNKSTTTNPQLLFK